VSVQFGAIGWRIFSLSGVVSLNRYRPFDARVQIRRHCLKARDMAALERSDRALNSIRLKKGQPIFSCIVLSLESSTRLSQVPRFRKTDSLRGTS